MQNHSQEYLDLPPELCIKPTALIGISGLDTVNNAIHRAIWDAFSNNRRIDRTQVSYRLLANDFEFPPMKPKRNSYEWYIPKGILKRNWINKHIKEIPAVVVLFYDLDWTDTLWNEKVTECASRLQSMRAALEGRNTRLTVVLIQQTSPLPSAEDTLSVERANSFCVACELNPKSLLLMPIGDHLQGYAIRLEKAFFDLAQNYYHNEVRNIKSHRDHLKSTQQFLFVRHEFKMGFLNEMKQDFHAAHKHYKSAYKNVLDIRFYETNALEIKTVAGFINYKLCQLLFTLNMPRDAISQFKAHVDAFKSRIGFKELSFEHYAWLSKQQNIFGDIFDEAVKLGLPAVQTQHPGFYYQQAAQFAIQRRASCLEFCVEAKEYPSPDPLEGWNTLEFYGQRPWRPAKLSAEPPDPVMERSGIQALQYLEKQVNHSSIVIGLYSLAMGQFKQYKCPRMRRYLAVQMAEEYFYCKDYGKALTLLTHMLTDYRAERWWRLLTNVLSKALTCAYLLGSAQDYALLASELIHQESALSKAEKKRVCFNFLRVMNGMVPEPEPDLDAEIVKKAQTAWATQKTVETPPGPIEMTNSASCLECKMKFDKDRYEGDATVSIQIYIRNKSPFTLEFTRMAVLIMKNDLSIEYPIENIGENLFMFESGKTKMLVADFKLEPSDVGKDIHISHLLLSRVSDQRLTLRFTGVGAVQHSHPDLAHLRATRLSCDLDLIRPVLVARVAPRRSRLTISTIHAQPALLGEWYKVAIELFNAEHGDVDQLMVEVRPEGDDSNLERIVTDEFSSSQSCIPEKLPLNIKLTLLKAQSKGTTCFYMRSFRVGERSLVVHVSYEFGGSRCALEEPVSVPVVKPFSVAVQYCSERLFEPLSRLYVDEPFLVSPQITCCSPWPIIIENAVIELSSNLRKVSTDESFVAGICLENEECATDLFTVVADRYSDSPINVGQYSIFWRRSEKAVSVTSTVASLTGLPVDATPLHLDVELPAHGVVRTPMVITYYLENRGPQLIQLDVSMESNEAFMFAGYKQFHVSILPMSTKTVVYNMCPLLAGNVLLPKLKLAVPEKSPELVIQSQLNELLKRSLPTHVYIMPQAKGEQSEQEIAQLAHSPV